MSAHPRKVIELTSVASPRMQLFTQANSSTLRVMLDESEATLEAKLTRYRLSRLRISLSVLPVAVLASVGSRRLPDLISLELALAIPAAALVTMVSAIKRFGWQPLQFRNGGLILGSTGIVLRRGQVHEWTFVARVARLYSPETSYRLVARQGAEQVLLSVLKSQFGTPVLLARRGSAKQRTFALGTALIGLIAVLSGFMLEGTFLTAFGTVVFVLGISAFGAFSQYVRR